MFKSILTQSGGPKLAKRMFIVHSADELLTHYDQLENGGPPNFLPQEDIPGGEDSVWMFNGYFDENSDCMFGFTGKMIRQYPTDTVPTALGILLQYRSR